MAEEEVKEQTKGVRDTQEVIDSYVGRYKNEDELKIGDRSIDELVDIKEKNN